MSQPLDLLSGINQLIKNQGDKFEVGKIFDGYHTFDELYDHRCILHINLCLYLHLLNKGTIVYTSGGSPKSHQVWRSRAHSDGSVWEDWFLLGIDKEPGKQITYHLPMKYWFNTMWAETLDKAPEWDGHTSEQVLERLKQL